MAFCRIGDRARLRVLLQQQPHRAGRGATYEIGLDYCKGCGPCAAECPCGAIELTPERI